MAPTARTAPCNPAGPSPLRRPASIRRTTSLDSSWPDGFGQAVRMIGAGRDAVTTARGELIVTQAQTIEIQASVRREILAIAADPPRAGAERLVGARAGGHSRTLLASLFAEERAAGTLFHFLVDDFAGASLVGGWAWSRWIEDWGKFVEKSEMSKNGGRNGNMAGVCIGFAPGSSALEPDGSVNHRVQNAARVVPLPNPEDPDGWHPLAEQEGVGFRRARRLDLTFDSGKVVLDVGFQDSATSRHGGREAIHEYRVRVVADRATLAIESIDADPRVLPFAECPAAPANAQKLVGRSLADLRQAVLEVLPGTMGCTHLNDVLRSLADAPALMATLEAHL